jgi:hypothetical protein
MHLAKKCGEREVKRDAVLSDKQVQAGERQVGRRSKPLADRKECTQREPFSFPQSVATVQIGPTVQQAPDTTGNKDTKLAVAGLETETTHENKPADIGEKKEDKNEGKRSASQAVGKKVQVVEVSVGTATGGLSTFPYIQQMVLSNSQTSTSSQTTYSSATPTWPSATDSSGKEPARITCKPVVSSYQGPSGVGKPKSTTQIILPKNQVKLSVSIQTSSSSAGPSNAFSKFIPVPASSTIVATTNRTQDGEVPQQMVPILADGASQSTSSQSEPLNTVGSAVGHVPTMREPVKIHIRGKKKKSSASKCPAKKCKKENMDSCEKP